MNLINKDKLLKQFEELKEKAPNLRDAIYLDGVMAVIDSQPAVHIMEDLDKLKTIITELRDTNGDMTQYQTATLILSYINKIESKDTNTNDKKCTILNKEEFVKCINELKRHDDMINELNSVFKKYNQDITVFDYDLQDVIIKLLKHMFNDNGEDDNMGYFIYDLQYGTKYKSGMMIDKDGKDIPMGTAEDLYEFLVHETNLVKEDI